MEVERQRQKEDRQASSVACNEVSNELEDATDTNEKLQLPNHVRCCLVVVIFTPCAAIFIWNAFIRSLYRFVLITSKGRCTGGSTSSSVGSVDKALMDEIAKDIGQIGDECDTCLDASLVLQVWVKNE